MNKDMIKELRKAEAESDKAADNTMEALYCIRKIKENQKVIGELLDLIRDELEE